MKQTEKQKSEIEKKQTQVNGSPKFENGHLVSPVMNKKNKVTTPKKEILKTETKKSTTKKTEPKKVTQKVKPQVTVASFLTFLKKNLDNVESSTTSDNYERISINGKVFFYLKQGVRKPQVLGWNQKLGKQMHIVTKKDMDKLLVEIKKAK